MPPPSLTELARDLAGRARRDGAHGLLRAVRDAVAVEDDAAADAARRAVRILWDVELLPDERAQVAEALETPEAAAYLEETPHTRRLVDAWAERRRLEATLREQAGADAEARRVVAALLRALTEEAKLREEVETLRRRLRAVEEELAG